MGRVSPVEINMRYPGRDVDEVLRAATDDLIGDMRAICSRCVQSLGPFDGWPPDTEC